MKLVSIVQCILLKRSQCSFSLDHNGKDIKESENIASLHNQIASCDTILEASCFNPLSVIIYSLSGSKDKDFKFQW